jgi:hypothetical protein
VNQKPKPRKPEPIRASPFDSGKFWIGLEKTKVVPPLVLGSWTPKECRKLAAWLVRAAAWIEQEEEK